MSQTKSERNLELEIDEIKKDLQEIKELLKSGGRKEVREDIDGDIDEIKKSLEKIKSGSNIVKYSGSFASSDRESRWSGEANAHELLNLIETGTAVKVLNCIGNNDRLNILLAILKKPMAVAELVASGGYNSTGQVYHHLKPLITADLVAEDKNAAKGTYLVQPHKVQGIIMLLAGISDMICDRYTKGDWEEQAE